MMERGHENDFTFGPKASDDNPQESLDFKESLEEYMRQIDQLRRNELYVHECSTYCREKGCGRVATIDGNSFERNCERESSTENNNLFCQIQ